MYLTIITPGENHWNALVPELFCLGTAPTRDHLIRQTREAIAFALEDQPDMQPRLRGRDDLDPDLLATLNDNAEIIFLAPAHLLSAASSTRFTGPTRSTCSGVWPPPWKPNWKSSSRRRRRKIYLEGGRRTVHESIGCFYAEQRNG